jgi:hypothetical protein
MTTTRLRWLPLLLLALAALALGMGRKEAPERHVGAPDVADAPLVTDSTSEGIHGVVEIWEGNFMPPVDPQRSRGTIVPGARRRVRAHEPLKMAGGLASARRDSVPTRLVAETRTDARGRFFLPVPAGTYSVFVEEDSSWYFNGWSGDGIQGSVTVEAGKPSELLIKITTKAAF